MCLMRPTGDSGDLHARKQRNRISDQNSSSLHEQKKLAAARAWVDRQWHGLDQKAQVGCRCSRARRSRRGNDGRIVCSVATDVARYELDGAARLQDHLRAALGDPSAVVAPSDLQVTFSRRDLGHRGAVVCRLDASIAVSGRHDQAAGASVDFATSSRCIPLDRVRRACVAPRWSLHPSSRICRTGR